MGRWDVVVAGAGVFGAWTAWELQRRGHSVLLVDGAGPANARASSGGESRLTRTIYGADEVYTRMARDSLEAWQWLSGRAGLPVLHAAGVLMFFMLEPHAAATSRCTRPACRSRSSTAGARAALPQIAWEASSLGFEAEYAW
jgi:glycine/D-amino acid oxidase-like deaminating enzyme